MRVVIVVLACLMCCGEVSAQALLHSTTELPPVATAPAPATPAPARSVDTGSGIFRSGVDLVSLNVIVTDEKDKFVTGLSQKDFAVFEDGVQQDLSFFAAANVPLDLAILLDSSSSMSDKMTTVHQAAVGFASHLRPGDRIMVVGIKDSARTLHPLVGDEVYRIAREAMANAFRIVRHAPSLGGVDSLASLPAFTSHIMLGPEGRARAGIPEALVRLSIGIEDVEDLWEDLEQALARAATVRV